MKPVSVALDTNILAYAEGLNGVEKKASAIGLLERLPPESTFLPVQTLGELFAVLVRKVGRPPSEARAAILNWGDAFPLVETSASVVLSAADLATDHHFSTWDAVILAAAADAGCRLLLSEDMQDGFIWSGVTITNPFSSPRHPLLDSVLTADAGPRRGR